MHGQSEGAREQDVGDASVPSPHPCHPRPYEPMSAKVSRREAAGEQDDSGGGRGMHDLYLVKA